MFLNKINIFFRFNFQSEPFDDQPTYKGDIIVGLKFIPPESASSNSGSNTLRKFSTKSLSSTGSRSTKGALHVLVKEAKNLTPIKASGFCDAFCKRCVYFKIKYLFPVTLFLNFVLVQNPNFQFFFYNPPQIYFNFNTCEPKINYFQFQLLSFQLPSTR